MPPQTEGDVLSRIEFVLPKSVLQTAFHLSSGLGATFMSTNLSKRTATHIKLFKRNDESVSINCTVRALSTEQMHQPEHVMIDQVKTKQELMSGPQTDSVPVSQTLLNITSTSGERTAAVSSNPTCSTVVTHPAQIPDSLLAHDDISSPEKSHQLHQSGKELSTDTTEVPKESPIKSPAPKLPKKELHEETREVRVRDEFVNESPVKSADKAQEAFSQTQSPGRRSRRLLRSTQGTAADVDTKQASPVKVELEQSVKSKRSKEPSKVAVSPSKTRRSVNVEESSPRRPKRTSQLPARLAESELMMSRKRRTSSVDESSTPAKRVKGGKDTPENTDKSVEVSQGSADAQTASSPTKSTHKRRSRKGSAQGTDEEKTKAKSERTLPCPICAQLLREWENVFDHVKKQHTNHREYKKHMAELREKMKATCHMCGKEISRPSAIRMHVETMHTELAQAQCTECDSVLKSQRHLELHMKRCHLVSKRSHLCHLCPASFKVKAYLVTHLQNVHSKSATDEMKCDECGKTFSNDRYMKTHKLRVHGPKKFSCPHCSMGFSEPPNLRRHIQLIHEAPKQKRHFCPHCEKGFTLKSNLKGHIETIHLKKFPYQCDVCMEGFVRRKLLEEHKSASHRAGSCFKVKREPPSTTEQVIEIRQPGNVFTIQTVGGNIVNNQVQTIEGNTVHTLEGATIHTVDGNTIIQTVDSVGAIQTLEGVTEQVVEVPAHGSDGSTVAIHVEEGATESDDVQFCIVATPEMLEAFGLQDNK